MCRMACGNKESSRYSRLTSNAKRLDGSAVGAVFAVRRGSDAPATRLAGSMSSSGTTAQLASGKFEHAPPSSTLSVESAPWPSSCISSERSASVDADTQARWPFLSLRSSLGTAEVSARRRNALPLADALFDKGSRNELEYLCGRSERVA